MMEFRYVGEMRTGVYLITCLLTGRKYVGSAAVSFAKRFAQHRHDLRAGKHKSTYMQRSWDKYGEAMFEFVILERCLPEHAVVREQVWIDRLRPKFNTAAVAGSNLGTKKSPAQIEALRERVRRQNQAKPDKGVGHLLAIVRSPEFRARQSDRLRRAQAEGRYAEANRKSGVTRSHRHHIHGEDLTLAEAAAKYGRTVKSLRRRVERGASGDAIVAAPYSMRGKHGSAT